MAGGKNTYMIQRGMGCNIIFSLILRLLGGISSGEEDVDVDVQSVQGFRGEGDTNV